MKRHVAGRSTPLEQLIDEFEEQFPCPSESDEHAYRAWKDAMYAHAAEHGYDVLDVLRVNVDRLMNRRPFEDGQPWPSKKRRGGRGDR